MQEKQYDFPYHHIPYFTSNEVGKSYRLLEWGLEYLCYLRHIKEIVESLTPSSVLDIGCGDGRLLGILSNSIANKTGVDLSSKAINFARAFYQTSIKFENVNAGELEEVFDVVTAIEVLEHIPDQEVTSFLQLLEKKVNSKGHVIISVPTTVTPVNKKHYRHYDYNLLKQQLEDAKVTFKILDVNYVYHDNRISRLYHKLTSNRFWFIDIKYLNKLYWLYVWDKLRIANEKNGKHLIVVLQK